MDEKAGKKKGRRILAAGIRIVAAILLIVLVIACIPLTIPRFFGYEIYSVISGSMEPAIPVGSLVYIKGIEPSEVQEGDVIAFYGASDSASIITHRVVENRVLMGEFITKGDANQAEDMNPIPYEHLIGRVVRSIPVIGRAAEVLTSRVGKIASIGFIVAALLMRLLASIIEWEPKAGKGKSKIQDDRR